MNPKYFRKDFQALAIQWWRTLSINEMKDFEQKLPIAGDMARNSEIAEIFDSISSTGKELGSDFPVDKE